MNNLKLNLGRFNERVSYLSFGQNADYCDDSKTEVFYCTNVVNNNIISTKLDNGFINIPIFCIGACLLKGRINDPNVVKSLLSCIEFDVFAIIKKVLEKSRKNWKLEDIYIPIRKVEIFDDDKNSHCSDDYNGYYGWVEIGIGVMV